MTAIRSIAELEAVVGKKPPALDLKIVDHIDQSAQCWLSHSTVMFACLGAVDGVAITLAGGSPGFASASDHFLTIPVSNFGGQYDLQEGLAFGSLWLVPAMGETLRLNGCIHNRDQNTVTIKINECFLHCAKALIRSDFWRPKSAEREFSSAEEFIGQARFLALGTVDPGFASDLSPKGDPAGSLAILHDDSLLFPDRPGNKRTDSFRNLLAQPNMAGTLLVPGSTQVVDFAGEAQLSTDPDLCALFAVQGMVPKLVTRLAGAKPVLRQCSALETARLWPAAAPPTELNPAKIFAAHMRLSKDKSLSAKVSKTIVALPGLMNSALRSDYKNNLY